MHDSHRVCWQGAQFFGAMRCLVNITCIIISTCSINNMYLSKHLPNYFAIENTNRGDQYSLQYYIASRTDLYYLYTHMHVKSEVARYTRTVFRMSYQCAIQLSIASSTYTYRALHVMSGCSFRINVSCVQGDCETAYIGFTMTLYIYVIVTMKSICIDFLLDRRHAFVDARALCRSNRISMLHNTCKCMYISSVYIYMYSVRQQLHNIVDHVC